jgi:hypothetical protein
MLMCLWDDSEYNIIDNDEVEEDVSIVIAQDIEDKAEEDEDVHIFLEGYFSSKLCIYNFG